MTNSNLAAPTDGAQSRVSFAPDALPDGPDNTTPVPPPPPPDVDPVTLKLLDLQNTIGRLSPDELRNYLAENPDILALLVDGLHQTGGPGFLELLKRLRDLDVLPSEIAIWVNGYDLADSRAQPDTPGGSWTPPTRIIAEPKPLPPLPVPNILRPYVEAICELAGTSVGTSHSATMGAINLALSAVIDVASLAPDTHPSTLFLLTSSETGWRKSAAFKLAFRAHMEADDIIDACWEDARKAKRNRPPKQEGEGAPLMVFDPRSVSPVALRNDSTAEALLANLAEGRRTQSLASAEGGVALGGWSYGRGQIAQTYAKFNSLWSGESVNIERITQRVSIRVADARLCICLMMQPAFAAQYLLSDSATNGFSARSLLNRDIARPKELTFEWPVGTSARYYVDQLKDMITQLRRQQDAGTQFVDAPPIPVTVMRPTDGARTALREFLGQCQDAADSGTVDGHERGFLERGAEQAARYASMLAALRSLEAGEPFGESYTEADVRDAAAVISWHGLNLASYAQEADNARLVKAAQWTATRLHGWAAKSKSPQGTIQLLSLLGSYCAGDAKFAKDSPDDKRAIIELLQEYDFVRPAGRGSFMVNPLTPDTAD